MARARDVESALADPGYTPSRSDLEALLTVVMSDDEVTRERAERAIARLGEAAVAPVIAKHEAVDGRLRARLTRVVSRLARSADVGEGTALRSVLMAALEDEDATVRRQAIVGLGRLGGEGLARVLVGRIDRESKVEHHRALAEALGRSHDPEARAGLARLVEWAAKHRDPALDRILGEAEVKVRRGSARSEHGAIRVDARPSRPIEVWFHVRGGLEELLLEELPRDLDARILGPGLLRVSCQATLESLRVPRIALGFGFPLAARSLRATTLDEAVVESLVSEEANQLLDAFSGGSVRYRIEWAGAGRRRGASMQVAQQVLARRPNLVNDPREADWEAVVHDHGPTVRVELRPRGFTDERFAYRKALLPAGSHPTLAAALARAAKVNDRDVVWDPFVGSATELIECARLARGATLLGCDTDEQAIAAARENLAAAGVTASLTRMDARAFRPSAKPTLLVSNPPMGRRVLDLRSLHDVFAKLLERAAEWLPADGRIVWLSPLPRETAELGRRLGFTLSLRREVDMGGFSAELQRFIRTNRG